MDDSKKGAIGLIVMIGLSLASTLSKSKRNEVSQTGESLTQTSCSIGNPYESDSGHYVGYQWAEENDPSECDGNSESFNEGCEEYLDQMICLQKERMSSQSE